MNIDRLIIILLALVLLPACANLSSHTYQTGTIKGKTLAGDQIGYTFSLEKGNETTLHQYLLMKHPYCEEEVEELAMERNRAEDVTGAAATAALPLGLIFPRVGQTIILMGLEKSRGEQLEPVGTVNTGKVVPCGDAVPAPDEKMILQPSDGSHLLHLKTDASGSLNISKVVKGNKDERYINIFVDNGGSAYYIDTLFVQ